MKDINQGGVVYTYTSLQLEQMSLRDYKWGCFRAALRSLITRVKREVNQPLTLAAVLQCCGFYNIHGLGLRAVALDQVVGSEERSRDFDRAFFPRRADMRDRWLNVNKALYAGVALPPVELKKVGDLYFVTDGHHRISVAREHGQDFIDAYVVEIVV
jgi:hypothetical protein